MDSGPKRRWNRVVAVLVALVTTAVSGCSSEEITGQAPVVEESVGQLGQGTFRWVCVDQSDSTCGTGVFPYAVAVGSRFAMSFTPKPGLPPEVSSYVIEAVSPRIVGEGPGGFEASVEGQVSMLVTGGAYGVDYVVLRTRPVARLELQLADPEGGASLDSPSMSLAQVGESNRIEAVPYYEGERLAGALTYRFENLSPQLISLSGASGNEISVFGVREGLARIAVTAGDYSEIVQVHVAEAPPEPPEPPDPTTAGSDTDGSSTGSGSDTGGETEGETDIGTGTAGTTGMGSGTSGDTDGSASTGGAT
ncbi:MAG: hypothetical protein AB1Z98_12900 [Nannocystaceae bacterium]